MKTLFISLLATLASAIPTPTPQDVFQVPQSFSNAHLISNAISEQRQALRDDIPTSQPFATAVPVDITPETHGQWREESDGSRVWSLKVESPGALNLNFGFGKYRLPEGATLKITSEEGQALREFTARDNKPHGELWTPPLDGDAATLELRVPASITDEAPELQLMQIGHGFLRFGDPLPSEDIFDSGSCNVDVVCSQGNGWRNEIRSVGFYTLRGIRQCTGALINNTAQNRRPLFLTAYHCDVTASAASSVVIFWNYENSVCRAPGSRASGRPGDGRQDQFTSGTRLLADDRGTDYAILELSEPPEPAFNVYYSGWDSRPGDFRGVVAIHHPSTDEKRISFENDATQTTNYARNTVTPNGTHIRVVDWDVGTTEGGSSGSPLYSLDKKIVGQLHGGGAACGNNRSDWYGRLSVSWDRGLKEVLDPRGTGVRTLDGLDS